MTNTEKEKLEILNGDRGDKSNAAARLKHIKALVNNLPVAPTGNATNDINALYSAINALRVALQ
ncbi:hypothetical protein D3C76_1284940 [compost metagenome]